MQKIKSADQTFHNGDGRQELGTVVTAEWLNAVQGELVAPIEAAGMTLADNDNGQLLKAINKIAGDAAGGANNNANGKVSKAGDTMSGALAIKSKYTAQNFSAVRIQNEGTTTNTAVGIEALIGDKVRGRMDIVLGAAGSEFVVSTDQRGGGVTPMIRVTESGIWARPYNGWLDGIFAKKGEARWNWSQYPEHNRGAQVFYHGASGLKIITMTADVIVGNSQIYLPESFSGFFNVVGCDSGAGKFAIGVSPYGRNGLAVSAPAGLIAHFICIGYHK